MLQYQQHLLPCKIVHKSDLLTCTLVTSVKWYTDKLTEEKLFLFRFK